MAITRRGAVARGHSTSSAPSITLPAGIQDGDWAVLGIAGEDTSVGTPAGWTLLLPTEQLTSSFRLTLYKKQMTAAESGTDVSWSGETGTKWGIAVWVGECDDIDDFEFLYESVTSATHTNASLTNTAPAATVSMWFERSSSPSSTITSVPAGMTLLDSEFGSGGGACSAAIADDLTVKAGGSTIGGGSWVANASNVGVVTVTFAPKDLVPAEPVEVAPSAGALAIEGGQATKTPPTRTDHVAALTYPQIIAHRGGNPGPENTIHAARTSAAISDSILIEVDLRVLSDGVLVGNHDDDIDRMASEESPFTTGAVSSFTSAQWAQILFHVNTGFTGDDQPASFWHEFVTEYAGTSRILVPEIKDSSATAELIRNVLDEGIGGQLIIQSFNLTDATSVAEAGLHAMHLDNTPDIGALSSAGVEFVGIDYATLTGPTGAGIVSDAHDAGLKVAVYLVNSLANRATAIDAGADLIFTNRPALLLLSVAVSPAAGALTITGTAPTVSTGSGVTLTPAAGALSLAGTGPAVSVGSNLTPAAGLLTFAATAPELAAAANVAATAGLLALTGTAPTVVTVTVETPPERTVPIIPEPRTLVVPAASASSSIPAS